MRQLPEAVIDLSTPDPRPPSTRRRQLRRRWHRSQRRVRAGLVGALVLAVLSGVGTPLDREFVRFPAPVRPGAFEVVGNLLFVAESPTRWVAYDLATGARRWSLDRPESARVGLAASGDLLFDLRHSSGRALDPGTGGVRWAGSPGWQLESSWTTFQADARAGAAVVTAHHRSTPDGLSHRFLGVELATGEVRWEAVPAAAARVLLAGEPSAVVSISVDGRVQLRAPGSGEVLASRALPAVVEQARTPSGVRALQVILVGDRLVLASPHAGGLRLHGYPADTLAGRWERTFPPPRSGRAWHPVRCGPMLCLGNSRVTLVLDPATGQVEWVTRASQLLVPVGDWFLAYRAGALRGLIDARTGQLVRDLSGWRRAVPGGGTSPVVLTRPVGGSGTRVARLDPVTGAVTEFGQLPGQPELCRPYHSGLVCRHHDALWVWPLPGPGRR